MTAPIVILAGGLLTAGKDEFADHLVRNHDFVKLGMSDTLAEALYRLNPYIVRYESWEYDNFPELPSPTTEDDIDGVVLHYEFIVKQVGYIRAKQLPEVRRLLQVLGTEVGRELFGQNFWVDMAKNKILAQLEQGAAGVVLTGARFPNEVELANTLNFSSSHRSIATTVWVDRPGIAQGAHASEASVSAEDFEYVLTNDGTLEQLYERSSALLDTIRADWA